jgi:ubiquinone/menaquinone biosynthesis C-methylase UbiE
MTNGPVPFANEGQRGLAADALPAYDPMLAAQHRAHAPELRYIISRLPLQPGHQVLDLACGSGTYAFWLAEQVGANGMVVGIDILPAYVEQAQERAAARSLASVQFQVGTVARLPFEDNTFDLAWCAYSLYSLPDLIGTLHELQRVVRPGGTVAILESDMLHQVIMPWPGALEMAVRQAQLRALEDSPQQLGKFFIGRQFCSAFDMAGLSHCRVTPYTIVRHAPLTADERTYLTAYFQDLNARARPYLDAAARESFDLLLNPESALFLPDRPDFYIIYIDMLAVGCKL